MQVIERDTIKKLKVVRIKTDVEYFWKERIKSSSDLFEKPNEMYDSKLLQRWLPKLRFRKQKDGDLQVGEEFYMNGVMKYSGTYNAKGQRHGKGIAYKNSDNPYYVHYNNQNDCSDFLGLSELCRCNYENGKLHGVQSYVNQGTYHSRYLYVNDPNATPTYSKKDQFRLVQASKLIPSYIRYGTNNNVGVASEYSICKQNFFESF